MLDRGRESSRIKSINLTKLQSCYKKYIKTVDKSLRDRRLSDKYLINTPDYKLDVSNSVWNKKLSNWRRLIHLWDKIDDKDCELLSNLLKNGNLNEFTLRFESLTHKNDEDSSNLEFNAYNNLLSVKEDSNNSILAPVIYKPKWFNGNINHKGFITINEDNFLKYSNNIKESHDLNFNKFYDNLLTKYIN